MYKLNAIALIISFLGIGCSVLRKGTPSEEFSGGHIQDSVVLRRVESNNVSQAGFFIKGADIKVNSGESIDNVVAAVRFSSLGEYLVSVKSRAGIEAIRVFIGRDTLMINDRINKIMYAGDPKYIERKFFIPESMLPLIFGDFVQMSVGEKVDTVCIDGKLNYKSSTDNMSILYVIDCKLGKTVRAFIDTGVSKERITLLYSDFKKAGELTFPGKIEVSGLPDMMTLKIEVNNLECPWSGEISFIPGSKYEIVKLK